MTEPTRSSTRRPASVDGWSAEPIDYVPPRSPIDDLPGYLKRIRHSALDAAEATAGHEARLTDAARDRGLARLRFAVAWCGPWERAEAWLLGIDAGSLDLRRVIREHSLREAVAVWCGSRDLAWQRRHVERGTSPARRWRRSGRGASVNSNPEPATAGRALFESQCADMLAEAERDGLDWTWDTLLPGTRQVWIASANEERRGDWMQTFTGRAFYPLDPRAEDVHPRDIAHALAHLCRYAGHVKRFYSVAEHCVLMSRAVAPEFALWALLHDATEAYVVDVPRPLKRNLPEYRAIEDRVMEAICDRFQIDYGMPGEVKDADNRILLTERAALLGPSPRPWNSYLESLEPLDVEIGAWGPVEAEIRYLDRLGELS